MCTSHSQSGRVPGRTAPPWCPAENTCFLSAFAYVCPEPVLVNRSCLNWNGRKKAFSAPGTRLAAQAHRASVHAPAGPCENRHFGAIYNENPRSFCQDRLGTNIGKTQKKMPFSAPPIRGSDLAAGCGRAATLQDVLQLMMMSCLLPGQVGSETRARALCPAETRCLPCLSGLLRLSGACLGKRSFLTKIITRNETFRYIYIYWRFVHTHLWSLSLAECKEWRKEVDHIRRVCNCRAAAVCMRCHSRTHA